MPSSTDTLRVDRLLLLGLFIVVLGAAALVEPGPFSIDEVTYQLMAKSLTDGHGVKVWNGYEEYPSVELGSTWVKPFEGSLYGQYPLLYVILAAPFQALLGFRGLFVLNALAHVVAVWLCFRLALELLEERGTARLAAALFAGATFSIDYAVAAWPHALSTALVLGTCVLSARAWRHVGDRRGLLEACAAGACLGVGVGVRLDVVLVVPVLLVAFACAPTLPWRLLASGAAGAALPIAASSLLNWQRWGVLSPASYGPIVNEKSLPRVLALWALLGALLALSVLVRWLVHAPKARRVSVTALALVLVPCAALLVPAARSTLLALAQGLGVLLIDLRWLPLDNPEPAMMRGSSGAVLYVGALKKALLQSCPYLGALASLGVLLWRRRGERMRLLLCAALPAFFILFYARTSWHGGMALNLRYFCPALPFLAVLAAYAWRALVADDGKLQWPAIGLVLLVTSLALFVTGVLDPLGASELAVLDVPLALAVAVALLSTVAVLWPSPWRARAASAVMAVGVAWSFVLALGYDARRSHEIRAFNYDVGRFVAEHVSDDSLLFVEQPDAFYSVIDWRQRVRIALPRSDGFRDLRALADLHLAQGRSVSAVFSEPTWQRLSATPLLDRYSLCELGRLGPLSLRALRVDGAARVAGAVTPTTRASFQGACAARATLEGS
jgi:hypothetical protein